MSYIDNISEFLKQKEIAETHIPKHREVSTQSFVSAKIKESKKIIPQPQQLLIKHIINPNTTILRLLIEHATGTGKTLLALGVADNFIAEFSKIHSLKGLASVPTVFIIGFTKRGFQKELMTRPEFGFISKPEAERYSTLTENAISGSVSDKQALADFELKIKKRISNRQKGGYYRFIGYKELFNKLFISEKKFSDEKELARLIKSGAASINIDLLNEFANSLVICDEIHNLYNAMEANNYGLALKVIFHCFDFPEKYLPKFGISTPEILDNFQNSILRCLFMSATPINNNPTEVVDLLNILIPIHLLPGKQELKKSDFFKDNRTLLPGALKKIGELFAGFVSFYQDSDPEIYPKRIFLGDEVKIPAKMLPERAPEYGGTTIPYLKFDRCPMTEFHQRTYDSFYSGTVSTDSYAINDMAFPNPDDAKIGLYKSKHVNNSIKNASQNWLDSHRIEISRDETFGEFISGEFWRRDTISKYSSKYTRLIDLIWQNLRNREGKVIISHQYVKISGVVAIREILRKNGIIDEYSQPSESTLCSKCGAPRSKKHSNHEFIPARFIVVTGSISQNLRHASITKFNDVSNVNGDYYRFAVGSEIINEAIDFSAVRNIWIASVPDDFSSIIQIIGRGYRAGSHLALPENLRTLSIRVLVSTVGEKNSEFSYEMKRYFEKSQDHIVTQKINRERHQSAVDTALFYDKIVRDSSDSINLMHFKKNINYKLGTKLSELNTEKFTAWYNTEELYWLTVIIKRLFVEFSPVWQKDKLWEEVRDPGFRIPFNTMLIDKDNFELAMYFLSEKLESVSSSVETDFVLSMFDDSAIVTMQDGVQGKIVRLSDYYIFSPFDESEETESENKLGKLMENVGKIQPLRENIWDNYSKSATTNKINVTEVLRQSEFDYPSTKLKFYKKFKDVPVYQIPVSTEMFSAKFHKMIIQDCVKYLFDLLTGISSVVSEFHDFYLKLLYYYDKFEMLLFASDVESSEIGIERYKMYTASPSKGAKLKTNAFLQKSITQSSYDVENMQLEFKELNAMISKSVNYRKKSAKKITKVASNILPVGHFISEEITAKSKIPYLYNPDDETKDEWIKSYEFTERANKKLTKSEKDNDIIIGYYEFNNIGINARFKVRPPQNSQKTVTDKRFKERGIECGNKKKHELEKILSMLGISVKNKSLRSYCDMLKKELMIRELKERKKIKHLSEKERESYVQVRWFYMHYENNEF